MIVHLHHLFTRFCEKRANLCRMIISFFLAFLGPYFNCVSFILPTWLLYTDILNVFTEVLPWI